MRIQECKEMLMKREYNEKDINVAIDRIKLIKREDALEKVVRERNSKKATFVIKFDPRLPKISKIVKQNFQFMCENDSYLANVFAD